MGEEGGKRVRGARKDISYLDREGKIREKLIFLINNLAQTGKILLHWFDGNQFLTFPAKGMAFKVSCGGCNGY